MAVSIVAASHGNERSDGIKARALLEKAMAETNIQTPASPAFLLEADAQFTDGKTPVRGEFGLSWAANDLYKQRIILPGFSQTLIVSGNRLYRDRNSNFLPLPAYEWAQMLTLPHTWSLPADLKFDSGGPPPGLVDRVGNVQIRCVAGLLEGKRSSIREKFCIDTDDSVPLSIDIRYPEGRTIMYKFLYGSPFDNKRFPHTITYDDSIGLHASITVRKLEKVTAFAPTEFQSPNNAAVEDWCANPTFKSAYPEVEAYAKDFNKWSGTPTAIEHVGYIYVRIDKKGKLQTAVLLYPSDNVLLKDTVAQVYHGKFAVKLCGGQPVDYESVVQFDLLQPLD
ncbi:MAG: hypothetical protein ACRD4H_02955 [Candidatus Acidiferrales bacterium]